MKTFASCLLLCLLVTVTVAQRPRFNAATLTKEESENCKLFKDSKGKDRVAVFKMLSHVLPQAVTTTKGSDVSLTMTRKQVVSLLGEFDTVSDDTKTADYYLTGGVKCMVSFVFDRNGAISQFSMSGCPEIK